MAAINVSRTKSSNRLSNVSYVSSLRTFSKELSISTRGLYVTPSPYGGQRPCKMRGATSLSSQVVHLDVSSSLWRNSRTNRDLPIPGTPSKVIKCGRCSAWTRAYVACISASSSVRPTRRASSPSSPRGCCAMVDVLFCCPITTQAVIGSVFPLSLKGASARKSNTFLVERYVRSPTRMVSGVATDCNRAATLTASPVIRKSPLLS